MQPSNLSQSSVLSTSFPPGRNSGRIRQSTPSVVDPKEGGSEFDGL
jgi:hypothetical protein